MTRGEPEVRNLRIEDVERGFRVNTPRWSLTTLQAQNVSDEAMILQCKVCNRVWDYEWESIDQCHVGVPPTLVTVTDLRFMAFLARNQVPSAKLPASALPERGDAADYYRSLLQEREKQYQERRQLAS